MSYKPRMTESRSPTPLALLAAAARTVAGLSYLLPWLTVSVGARLVVAATGLNLATGEIAVRVPILGSVESRDGPLALPLILAEIAIAAGIGASLVAGRRRGALAGLILSGLALCLIGTFVGYGLYTHAPLPPEQMDWIERIANSIVRQVVHVRAGIGFWLVASALIVAMLLDGANLRASKEGPQSD